MESESGVKKHPMGRQKIEIKKIEKKSSLQVTFSKRRTGLFKKAGELSALCGVDVAVLVRSPAGKVFAFSSPSADAVINRFLAAGSDQSPPIERLETKEERDQVAHPLDQLETKKEREKTEAKEEKFWWIAPIEELELNELERFLTSLEALRENVKKRADELAAARTASQANVLPSDTAADPFGDLTIAEALAGPATTFGRLTVEEEGIFDYDYDFDFNFDDVNLF